MMPSPKYAVGQIVVLKSGSAHKVLAVYEFKPERGYRYLTMTVKPNGQVYGPSRNITCKSPVAPKAAVASENAA